MPGLFSTPSPPPTPQVAVAPPMPDQQAPAVVEAGNQAAVTATQRAGRQSTMLGRQPPSTVADSYSGTKLGSNQ